MGSKLVGQQWQMPNLQGWQDALLWLAFGIALIIPLAAAVTGTSDRSTGVQQSLREALGEAMRTPSFHYAVLELLRVRLPDRLHHAAPAGLRRG